MASETRPTDTVLTEDRTDALQERVRGEILRPDDDGYDEARAR